MFEDLPPYDPAGAKKALNLRLAYDAMAELYTACSQPDAKDGAIYHQRMGWEKTERYEGDIRRALLSACETADDFRRTIYDSKSQDPTEEKIRGQLRAAFDARARMPYGGVVKDGPGLFHSLDTMGISILEYEDFFPRGDGIKHTCQTMVAMEIAQTHINLCFTEVPGNDLRPQIDYVADAFYKILSQNVPSNAIRGKPVNVFMHVPVEMSLPGRDEFYLVDSLNTVHNLIPGISSPGLVKLTELPRTIDYLFYTCRDKIADFSCRNVSSYGDFRGFSLRTM